MRSAVFLRTVQDLKLFSEDSVGILVRLASRYMVVIDAFPRLVLIRPQRITSRIVVLISLC